MVQKTLGLPTGEIVKLCKDIGSMSEDKAKEMADFIEKQLIHFIDAYESVSSAITS
jgi:hypothetical protein